MPDRIQLRRDTEADWESNDPTLASGEPGVVTDTNELVVGDGATGFTGLPRIKTDGPVGMLGYAEVTASQTAITNADLTGLSVTVTVAASRRVRIRGQVLMYATTADERGQLRIRESSTVLSKGVSAKLPTASNKSVVVPLEAVVTPSSGSHTYKLTVLSTDTSTVNVFADSEGPAYILVEDLGPA